MKLTSPQAPAIGDARRPGAGRRVVGDGDRRGSLSHGDTPKANGTTAVWADLARHATIAAAVSLAARTGRCCRVSGADR
jgi:hypothetical protein